LLVAADDVVLDRVVVEEVVRALDEGHALAGELGELRHLRLFAVIEQVSGVG
jgi:hypothetical protein